MNITYILPDQQRLDIYLSSELNYSRSYVGKLIKNKLIKVNNNFEKPSYKLKPNDLIEITSTSIKKDFKHIPNIDIEIIFENDDFYVINKPSGIPVHTAITHSNYSLCDYMIDNNFTLANIIPDRPGIVHRLDKDTSGLMLIAKNNDSYEKLINIFKNRDIIKSYYAYIFSNKLPEIGIINSPIARSKQNPVKMTLSNDGKEAISKFKVVSYTDNTTLMDVNILTGRTHQIRVHFSSLNFPVLGDEVYGHQESKALSKILRIKRQLLHAYSLEFKYNEEEYSFKSKLPDDFQAIIDKLKD